MHTLHYLFGIGGPNLFCTAHVNDMYSPVRFEGSFWTADRRSPTSKTWPQKIDILWIWRIGATENSFGCARWPWRACQRSRPQHSGN